jgi:hypothetical protein
MKEIEISDDGTIVDPRLHDGLVRGLLLCASKKVLIPIEATNGSSHCLVMHGVERLRMDDFRQGNIILDVTVSSGVKIEPEDVSYAYDLDDNATPLLMKTMDRLVQEGWLVVRINPSYGCSAVFVCNRIGVETDTLPQ